MEIKLVVLETLRQLATGVVGQTTWRSYKERTKRLLGDRRTHFRSHVREPISRFSVVREERK